MFLYLSVSQFNQILFTYCGFETIINCRSIIKIKMLQVDEPIHCTGAFIYEVLDRMKCFLLRVMSRTRNQRKNEYPFFWEKFNLFLYLSSMFINNFFFPRKGCYMITFQMLAILTHLFFIRFFVSSERTAEM